MKAAKSIFQLFDFVCSIEQIEEEINERGEQVFVAKRSFSRLLYKNRTATKISLENEYRAHRANIQTNLKKRTRNKANLDVSTVAPQAWAQ